MLYVAFEILEHELWSCSLSVISWYNSLMLLKVFNNENNSIFIDYDKYN